MGLTEDSTALQKGGCWLDQKLPQTVVILSKFEKSMDDGKVVSHQASHTPHHQAALIKDVNFLMATFNDLGNPFLECSKELLTLDTKNIVQ